MYRIAPLLQAGQNRLRAGIGARTIDGDPRSSRGQALPTRSSDAGGHGARDSKLGEYGSGAPLPTLQVRSPDCAWRIRGRLSPDGAKRGAIRATLMPSQRRKPSSRAVALEPSR